ncbi:50S ribosomal protein L19 [bacterium]|nr:50S ribosomal protein L19 [bacterium]
MLNHVEKGYLKVEKPDFRPGDTIKVFVKIKEGDKERVQPFQGIVLREKGGGINKTITVRKISYGVGIERIFFYHSPNVEKIEVVRRGHLRRAKLYYLRDLAGKAARVKEKKYVPVKKKVVKEEEEIEN